MSARSRRDDFCTATAVAILLLRSDAGDASECLADRSGPALPSGDGGLPGTPADSVLGQILNDLSEPCLNDVVSSLLDPLCCRSSVVALEMNIASRGQRLAQRKWLLACT